MKTAQFNESEEYMKPILMPQTIEDLREDALTEHFEKLEKRIHELEKRLSKVEEKVGSE
jgi:polyhydroxyalkanoate synthesis regulator phasin